MMLSPTTHDAADSLVPQVAPEQAVAAWVLVNVAVGQAGHGRRTLGTKDGEADSEPARPPGASIVAVRVVLAPP